MKRTKLFMDLEFTGLKQNIEIISLGITSQHGYSFYAELIDFNMEKATQNKFLVENVLPHLWLDKKFKSVADSINYKDFNDLKQIEDTVDNTVYFRGTLKELKPCLKEWLIKFGPVEIWGDCISYDWILFCEIFGGAENIPKNVYYIPFDIATLFLVQGLDPDLSREDYVSGSLESLGSVKHNALSDAKVALACYRKLNYEI